MRDLPADPTRPTHKRFRFGQEVLLWALAAGVPGVLAAMLLVWFGDYPGRLRWTVTLFAVGGWLALAWSLRQRITFTLYTLANLMEALRLGDYSLRARHTEGDDAMAQVLREVNAMRDTLREERLEAREATALLARVVEEIDVAVFTFDHRSRLRLVNPAAERLLDRPGNDALGLSATDLGLDDLLSGPPARTAERSFPGGDGRWATRRSIFRQDGLPHHLLVVTDLSRTLREEERQAWKRLIRVLGHELNNSLAPIKSMSATLSSLLSREPRADDWEEDMKGGLDLISNRSESLSRFLAAYSRLARLPPPTPAPTPVAPLVERLAALETRLPVAVQPGPDLLLHADADQLEQLLINLVRNAADAALETGGGVTVGWETLAAGERSHAGGERSGERSGENGGDRVGSAGRNERGGDIVELWVRDDGPGLSNIDNLFVPFYTTKPGGTGIGLVLSRQIAEAHGGTLTLENLPPPGGVLARLRLPASAHV